METQEFVSQVTGVPSHKVNARVKRMGGAFGGKESRSCQLASILAVAAKKEGRPMRCMLNRDEDMMTSGQRHPVQARWKVGTKSDGTLVALEADVYGMCNFLLNSKIRCGRRIPKTYLPTSFVSMCYRSEFMSYYY
jgi:xanthine dehydrogenase/oxidase